MIKLPFFIDYEQNRPQLINRLILIESLINVSLQRKSIKFDKMKVYQIDGK